MEFRPITQTDEVLFHSLLTAYYREGEDADTPQEELDEFFGYLFGLLMDGTISGCIAWQEKPAGFCLWWVDREDLVFSHRPGEGTILEIGVTPEFRGRGVGKLLAQYAENQLPVCDLYICAYGPAEAFWRKCGFRDSGETAKNGLKLMVKRNA